MQNYFANLPDDLSIGVNEADKKGDVNIMLQSVNAAMNSLSNAAVQAPGDFGKDIIKAKKSLEKEMKVLFKKVKAHLESE